MSGEYWTSTTGLVGAYSKDQPEDFDINVQYSTSTWSTEQKYRAGSALHAYVQNFSDGVVSSQRKKNGSANVRLVKRIPIYVVSKYCYTPNAFPTILNCNSCGACPCGGEQII